MKYKHYKYIVQTLGLGVVMLVGLAGCGNDKSFACDNTQVQENIKQMLSTEVKVRESTQHSAISLSEFKTLHTSEDLLQCQARVDSALTQLSLFNPLQYEVTKDLHVTLILPISSLDTSAQSSQQ
ncbi:hypothetical protein [uncultured Helicobacter sp.]|uniref:hypothetical protein n=1 Tax=uncultured Helicobacter sp. TaxID=175537 RepID=UPI001C3B3EAD|nr:hypothetical protein [Candidatus Helicobacter avicola]